MITKPAAQIFAGRPRALRPMRGMMSLWTGTPMFRADRGPLIVQTLAICLAREVFPELFFITDERGAELARMLGWSFAHVSTALEAMPAERLEHVWALGKLAALIIATEDGTPVCQMDGDVLLFAPLPAPLQRAPLLAQSPDPAHFYRGEDMERGFAIAELPRSHVKWNAGLLGGADVPLLRAYAYASLEYAAKFRGQSLNGTVASMIVEQAHLGVFARRTRVEVGALFPAPPMQLAYAHYAHLSGAAKRNPLNVARYTQMLRTRFPEAAASFEAGWREVRKCFPAHQADDCGCGCHGSGGCGDRAPLTSPPGQ